MIRKVQAPKQERAIQNKAKIFEAAERVFSKRGFSGARIEEIANLAGTNKQRIYAYYHSKKELYRQVILKIYSQVATNELIMKLSEDDIPELTGILLKNYLKFHREHPRFWRLLAWENLNHGKTLTETDWNNVHSSYIIHLKGLFTIGQDKGFFKKEIDFSTYLFIIFSITNFYYSNQLTIANLLKLQLGSINPNEQFVAELETIVNEGCMNKI